MHEAADTPRYGRVAVVTGAAHGIGRGAAVEALRGRTPLGLPWIAPEDVAPLVVFLASDDARMVSGATFAAIAGDSAHSTA
ncbi:SDR family oxidoreductase [Micromonospora sp. NPDC023737]|uniref:SDR family oxidoreductase n=1 Tax=unclassified Micromonospora TaxID=2617518 RepID=UPI00340F303A